MSFGVAAGFLWRFSATQSEAALGLGLALGLLAVLFGLAAGSAKTPLLVVDEASVRVRLGRQWIATPWGQVARVEVSERGRLGDGTWPSSRRQPRLCSTVHLVRPASARN